ncbi:MAG: hypothetical protein ACRDQ4_18840 [Pseudonocardiaceae bacterium]
MQIARALFVVAAAVVPLAFAIPAEARDELTYDEPTYTCDTVMTPGGTVFGEGNCTATNGAPEKGFITTGHPFFVAARTDLKQKIRCDGGTFDRPGGYADTPTTVTGNYCP